MSSKKHLSSMLMHFSIKFYIINTLFLPSNPQFWTIFKQLEKDMKNISVVVCENEITLIPSDLIL